jgi:hypothetical protein
VWKCTEKDIYTLYGRFAGGGEKSKTPTHFSKMMQNVLKPLAKIRKKWVRNIHAKKSQQILLRLLSEWSQSTFGPNLHPKSSYTTVIPMTQRTPGMDFCANVILIKLHYLIDNDEMSILATV